MRWSLLRAIHRPVEAQDPPAAPAAVAGRHPRGLCSGLRPYQEGTFYPQLVVGCDDHLNRALLREFQH
jgi:hypothetical protein